MSQSNVQKIKGKKRKKKEAGLKVEECLLKARTRFYFTEPRTGGGHIYAWLGIENCNRGPTPVCAHHHHHPTHIDIGLNKKGLA